MKQNCPSSYSANCKVLSYPDMRRLDDCRKRLFFSFNEVKKCHKDDNLE